MAIIFVGSSVPGSSAPGLLDIPHMDKALHLVEYALLGFLLGRALRPDGAVRWLASVLPAAIALVFGLSDEVHQIAVPERDFSLWDLAADGLGSLLGALAWWRLRAGRTETRR